MTPFRLAEDTAVAYLQQSEVRAVEAFAIARSLNAGISFFKHIEFKPWGVGVSPFQALEPVDDVAKDFSQVMIYSMVAIFFQQVFHKISIAIGLNVMLPVACAFLLVAQGLPQSLLGLRQRLTSIGSGILVLVLFARLVVPFTGWLGSEINQRFLANDLQNALHAMKSVSVALEQEAQTAQKSATSPEIGDVSKPVEEETGNFLSRNWRKFSDGAKSVVDSAKSIAPDLGALKNDLMVLPERMIVAIEIFIVQTVLLPGVLATLFYLGLRRFFGKNDNTKRIGQMADEIRELKLALSASKSDG